MPRHFPWHAFVAASREILLLALAAVGSLMAAYRRWSSVSWPETHATVESYRVIETGRTVEERNGITFSYQVDGEFYAGQMIVTRERRFPKDEDDMKRLYPRGSKIRLRYKPNDPSVHVAFPVEIPHRSVYFPVRDDPRS